MNETNLILVIFVLLPKKKKKINDKNYLYSIIKTFKNIPNLNPNIITIDFEATTIQAIKYVFLNTQISCYNYYFNQSLWRAV